MAGESAKEVARRQREKAERLVRSAALYEQGALGEERTAQALSTLNDVEWTSFHDIRWPGRRYANIDHVVVGPAGVFVIDSKNWTGSITVKDKVLRQNGRSREVAVAGAAEAAIALTALTGVTGSDVVRPVRCFVRDEPVSGWARDVMVCSTSTLVPMLRSRPVVLTPPQVREIVAALAVGTHAPPDPLPPRRTRPVPTATQGSSGRGTVAETRTRSRAPRRAAKQGRRVTVRLLPMAAVLGVAVLQPDLLTGAVDWASQALVDRLVAPSEG